MKAVQLSFDHERLNTISRELFISHGWKMPEGLAKSERRDPRNFTLAEWQQAKRSHQHAGAIKTAFQDAWAISDSKAAFVHALEERGYWIARGDRRGFVAVDCHGEVYSIPKMADRKTKEVRARLGDENDLPGVDQVKLRIAADMLSRLGAFREQLTAEADKQRTNFDRRRQMLVQRQRAERQTLKDQIEQRRIADAIRRQGRFRKGLGGLWDRLRGEHRRIAQQNEHEATAAAIGDRAETDALVFRHQGERQRFNAFQMKARQHHDDEAREVQKDMEAFSGMRSQSQSPPAQRRPRRRRGYEPER